MCHLIFRLKQEISDKKAKIQRLILYHKQNLSNFVKFAFSKLSMQNSFRVISPIKENNTTCRSHHNFHLSNVIWYTWEYLNMGFLTTPTIYLIRVFHCLYDNAINAVITKIISFNILREYTGMHVLYCK